MNKLILARLAAVFTASVLTACGMTAKSDKEEEEGDISSVAVEPVMAAEGASADLSSLSRESRGYGQGVQVDDKNRTLGALDFNSVYGKYNAMAINENDEKITLTFDQGYENGYTAQILDTLKEKNVKAIFFLVQDYAERNHDLVQRMIDEGHTVANHSSHHYSMPSLSESTCRAEVEEFHDYMKESFGVEMTMFRPPMGEYSEFSLAVTDDCGYQTVLWSYAYADWNVDDQPEPTAALEKLTNAAHPGAIYLLHSVSSTNAQVLGDMIDAIRANGFEFN